MANTPRENYPIPNVKGFTETLEIADPGAGNSWIFTIPQILNEWRYKVLLLSFTFTTDANVSNRAVGLRYFRHTGAYNWWRLYYPQVQPQNQAFNYMFALNFPATPWFPGGVSADINTHRYAPLPDFEFTNWERLGFSTAFMQAGDTVTDTKIMIRRWIDERD